MPIELKPVTLNELPLLQEQLPKLQNGDCNLSIASVIGRSKEYNIKWGISQGELVLNWAPYPDIPPAMSFRFAVKTHWPSLRTSHLSASAARNR